VRERDRRGLRYGALTLVAGGLVVGAAACGPGGGPGPSPTTSWSTPEIPATTTPGTPAPPSVLVAVRDDGALVVLDGLAGNEVRELADPSGGVAGVTLTPDAATAYFDTTGGQMFSVPTDGSAAPTAIGTGTSPEVNADGTLLAYLTDDAVVVRTLATGAETSVAEPGGHLSALAWAGPDLVWVRGGRDLVRLDRDGGAPAVTVLASGGPDEQVYATLGSTSLITAMVGDDPSDPDAERLVWVDPGPSARTADSLGGGARDRAWDRTASWGLRADAYHVLRWSVGGGTGPIAVGYTAADW
jgi:hypothetical protein